MKSVEYNTHVQGFLYITFNSYLTPQIILFFCSSLKLVHFEER